MRWSGRRRRRRGWTATYPSLVMSRGRNPQWVDRGEVVEVVEVVVVVKEATMEERQNRGGRCDAVDALAKILQEASSKVCRRR